MSKENNHSSQLETVHSLVGSYDTDVETRERNQGISHDPEDLSPEARARQLVREAEQSKAKIYSTKGNHDNMFDLNKQYIHSAMVDEDYMVIGGYVDEATVRKITLGDYVDVGKLLPRDKILMEEDTRFEMVIRGGQNLLDASPGFRQYKWF